MSNLKLKTYAQALADSLSEGSASKKTVARNFVKLLQQNGDLKKAGEILDMASALLLKKTGNKKIVLETAREADTQKIVKAFAKKGDVVEEKINPSLIAGVKIVIDGQKQLDFSLLKKIEPIFKID